MSLKDIVVPLIRGDPGIPNTTPTQSFWQFPPHEVANIRSESLPSTAQIVIIGSGITACSAAKRLLETHARAKITVLEGRTLTSGSTGRNGGHLTSASVGDFNLLSAAFGTEMAVKIASFTLSNVERVFTVAEEYGAEMKSASEIRRVESVAGLFDEAAMDEFKKTLQAFEKAMPNAWKGQYRVVDGEAARTKYGLRNAVGAVVGPAGAMWPYRFITNIFAILLQNYPGRLTIETSTPVNSVLSTAGLEHPYILSTPRGEIRASQVVYCTNAHTSHILPRLRGKIFPVRGTMTVQNCGPSFPNIGAARSWAFRRTPSVDPNTRIFNSGLLYMAQNAHTGDLFLGGEETPLESIFNSNDGEVCDVALAHLEKSLTTNLQGVSNSEVKSKWSGIMAFTNDGLPFVGRLPESATGRPEGREWISAGFNGYGMGNCWLCGEALADMILGRPVGDAFPEAYLISEARLELGPEVGAARLLG